MKKGKNKFNKIRGKLKNKILVALCGLAGALGVYTTKEAAEQFDAEIALAAAKPVAQEVAYVEDSESTVLDNEKDQENVETKKDSASDKGILKKVENAVLWTIFGVEFTIIMTWVASKIIDDEKEISKKSEKRMKDFDIKDFSDYNDISITGNAYNTPDSDYRNTKENGFIPRI